jgi:uncharacterized protein (DUF2141 family)
MIPLKQFSLLLTLPLFIQCSSPASNESSSGADPTASKSGSETSIEPTVPDALSRLRLTVQGIETGVDQGRLRVAVYDSASSFNKIEKAIQKGSFPLDQSELEISLPKEFRRIAVAVYLDANENDKLDKNAFGIPTERYGFSRNPKRGFGPPAFEETAIEPGEPMIIELR